MEIWLRTSLILCVFGALKEFRPSEPFVTPYLTDYRNFTEEEVNQEIYPVGTYSYLCLLVVIFLVTDLLRYKPVIILIGVTGIILFILLALATNVLMMQIVEVLYGLYMAAEVAYFTYIYAQVDKEHYQLVTSHTRTAFLFGRFMSGVVSQSLVSTETSSTFHLIYITIASQAIATVWAFLLPTVKHSLYFHRRESVSSLTPHDNIAVTEEMENPSLESNTPPVHSHAMEAPYMIPPNPEPPKSKSGLMAKCCTAYALLWKDCRQAFTNMYVLKWSIWWAVATCGFLQSITYMQMLWEAIMKEKGNDDPARYNGAIEAAYTIIGAFASFGFGFITLKWELIGELALALCSGLQGAVLLASAFSSSIWVAYTMYIVFGVLYHAMITIANSEVAKHINEDSYALIFGINTFIALVLQTILTLIIVSDVGLSLSSRDQFKVYGSCYLVMGALFMALALFKLGKHFLFRNRPSGEENPKTVE